ncbi:uncharacterized protein LOC109140364 [Larimichthys crocea]|uniref:uncharacterized protein LOC109140364 n=1 Tax=Larimichthys crocea TaxID=215358 RepID=UPI000F604170|nr:uncharacterized protein LOC109140364 [Larimichthys crocea]
MNDEYSFNNIDSLLFRFGLRIQELSQKKNDINQQNEVLRADIAERKSCIEAHQRDIKKLEEDIRVKKSTVIQNKENAKSMKATNGLLLQYEQRLKEELESGKASYMRDMKVYEERAASYRKIFQSHKEHYCKDPLAQKLLMLQADKEEIESRIKACDDQITMKQKELDHLTDPAEEELPDSVSGQQAIKEPEKQLDPHTEEDSDSSIDISSLHLNQTEISENGRETSVDANAEKIHEENKDRDASICSPFPGETKNKLWSSQLDGNPNKDVKM